jgi:hypothetical protein
VNNGKELNQYLQGEIFPHLASPPYGAIETTLISQRPVYLFQENFKHVKAVGKPFQCGDVSAQHAWATAEREFSNLKLLRERYGMGDDAFQVVKPLGKNSWLSALVVVSYADGKPVEHYIDKAIYERQPHRLFHKLASLACFFRKLHYNTGAPRAVSVSLPQWYLERVLNTLSRGILSPWEKDAIKRQAAGWWNRSETLADNEVIVHGDATPTNFLFHRGHVTAIDLEKMKWADRCWDLGFIAAELKHHFIWRTGDGAGAEPFIGHFLWEYAAPDDRFFHRITSRLPLYMALGLLRIARNRWLGEGYRRNLIREARLCLEYKP